MTIAVDSPVIVSRKDIPSLTQVKVNNVNHTLGILKDFSKDSRLDQFVPSEAKVTFAWTHLDPGEVLLKHIHPMESLILITKGEGSLQGDLEQSFSEGDAILVPAGAIHGLTGGGDKGFWALSIQFIGQGIYEDSENPMVKFVEHPAADSPSIIRTPSFELLMEENLKEIKKFGENRFFTDYIGLIAKDKNRKDKFAKLFSIWTNEFQKMMLLRSGLCEEQKFSSVFNDHLEEEFGHNKEFDTYETFDTTISTLSSWFRFQMLSADRCEQALLVHLVLEAGATVFYPHGPKIFDNKHLKHANLHQELDNEHYNMGINLLKDEAPDRFQRLISFHRNCWDVLNEMILKMGEKSVL